MAMAQGTLGTSEPAVLVPGVPVDCSGDDAHAVGRGPLAVLRQVAATCAYPDLLGSPAVPESAQRRARRILQEMDAGNIGGYNHEHRALGVPTRVARFLERRDGGVPCHPRNIILCNGTASILPFVLSLVVDERVVQPTGVLVPVPGPPLHAAAAGLAGAVAVPYPLAEEQGWAVAGEALRQVLRQARVRCHPKVLCIVNPGDPTGHVLSRQSMEDIIRLVAEEHLLLLADEVQQERAFLPGCPFLSFKRVLWEMGAPLASTVQLVSFYSLSKSVAGESGFRVGFLELVNIEEGITLPFQLAQSIPRPCVLGRILLDLLMDPPDEGDPIQKALEEQRQGLRRDLAHNARRVQEVLGRAPGICCQPVQGGARAFPRIQLPPRALQQARVLGLEPDVFFCQELREATGVVLAPGSEFGQPEGTYHIGLSLLPPAETLEPVLLALTRFHTAFLRHFS
ncbi:alanine aminotransferase 1-like [Falco rusticolus]|uniref:alanine aminotransferase 1-like n=1 Tax=Falco rusticolus TaxID=120794 RepID=UPI00188663D3|nr:alanine aminotransferase 1-like [Falco rusticolus]